MSLTKLATALTVIFVISLVALIAELLFVLWRRHILRRQNPPAYGADLHPQTDASISPAVTAASSKEQLLYFLCLKTSRTRIDPSGAPVREANGSLPEDQVIDVLKLLESMHGPSRVLCTIKEEDREGVESDDSAKKSKRVCLQACFEVETAGEAPVQEVKVAVPVVDDDDDVVEATPFSTPCASPLYFTPSASPSRDVGISC